MTPNTTAKLADLIRDLYAQLQQMENEFLVQSSLHSELEERVRVIELRISQLAGSGNPDAASTQTQADDSASNESSTPQDPIGEDFNDWVSKPQE